MINEADKEVEAVNFIKERYRHIGIWSTSRIKLMSIFFRF